MGKLKKAVVKRKPASARKTTIYSLEVSLLSGPVSGTFARRNPVVMRRLQIRGDQTLADLHEAIFKAFGRDQDNSYEFQFGKGPMDPEGPRYVLPGAFEVFVEDGKPAAGRVTETTLSALRLEQGRTFSYWFDFGDDWWHQVTVEKVEAGPGKGKYPRVTKRVGDDPPQFAAADAEANGTGSDPAMTNSSAADAACLVGELHLRKERFAQAVEAFTRAIEACPTVDAYQGRAKAYQGLAANDNEAARRLR